MQRNLTDCTFKTKKSYVIFVPC